MTHSRLKLGPFDLTEPIGVGGMGSIWSGRHVASAMPVAVKFIRPEHLQGPKAKSRFRQEVRAVAGLDHPSVVEVYDYGTAGPELEAASEGAISAGSPYLAMELARLGSVEPLAGKMPWRGLRAMLLQILDGLAHAHARRLVHLDVKPANVLLCGDGARAKLTDFGIARVVRGDEFIEGRVSAQGTPAYMAPEQFRGEWRALGPWTDLYAVGGLAYVLASGKPPFEPLPDFVELYKRRRKADPPKLPPECRVPEGFQDWLNQLLRARARDRLQFAADAAVGLAALPEWLPGEEARGSAAGGFSEAFAPTLLPEELAAARVPPASLTTGAMAAVTTRPDAIGLAAMTTRPDATGLAAVTTRPDATALSALAVASPAPDFRTWRRGDDEPHRSPTLHGAGLGLYGLRTIRMVDRDDERDLLWGQLLAVRFSRRARVVVVRGASGYGKTRLAEWLRCRAEEQAAAITMMATHSPIAARGDGLRGLLVRHLRTAGLSPEKAKLRLLAWLRRNGVPASAGDFALGPLVQESDEVDGDGAFLSEGARHTALLRLLRVAARSRPILMHLDDGQWGLDSLSFVERLLSAQASSPVAALVVITVRDEALPDRIAAASAIERIEAHEAVRSVTIGPLPEKHSKALVRDLLGLEGRLAGRLERLTAGNPLFAVQLVGDWVERGLLEPGPRGFQLREGARVELPDDLHGVWRQRIDRLLDDRPVDDEAALELAAALGQDLSSAEWLAVCAASAVTPSPDLLEELLRQRLARRNANAHDERWSFAHGMLRESLLRRAEEAGRRAGRHRACALYLAGLPGLEAKERRARQTLAAGDAVQATELLLDVAEGMRGSSRLARLSELAENLEEALGESQLPASHPWRGQAAIVRLRQSLQAGSWNAAIELIGVTLVASEQHGWDEQVPILLSMQAHATYHLARFDDAAAIWRRAEQKAMERGDLVTVNHCLRGLAGIAAFRGHPAESAALAERSLAICRELGSEGSTAIALVGLGRTQLEAGKLHDAVKSAEEAATLLRTAESPVQLNRAEILLGDARRLLGEPGVAVRHYRRAIERAEVFFPPAVAVQKMNLGAALQDLGQFPQGRALLDEAVAALAESGRRHLEGVAHAMLLRSLAVAEDWAGWDSHMEAVGSIVDSSGLVMSEVATAFEGAAEAALEADETERASAARGAALQQWRALGRDEEVARLGG